MKCIRKEAIVEAFKFDGTNVQEIYEAGQRLMEDKDEIRITEYGQLNIGVWVLHDYDEEWVVFQEGDVNLYSEESFNKLFTVWEKSNDS